MAKETPGKVGGGFSGLKARLTGGITGKGGKNVNPTYNESIPPLPQGAPKIKVSPNVTVKSPGLKGQLQTQEDKYHNPKYMNQ